MQILRDYILRHVAPIQTKIKKNYDNVFLKFVFIDFGQVERNIDLVYGGGSIGLMGLVSQAVFDGGRHVLGYANAMHLLVPNTLVHSFRSTAGSGQVIVCLVGQFQLSGTSQDQTIHTRPRKLTRSVVTVVITLTVDCCGACTGDVQTMSLWSRH